MEQERRRLRGILLIGVAIILLVSGGLGLWFVYSELAPTRSDLLFAWSPMFVGLSVGLRGLVVFLTSDGAITVERELEERGMRPEVARNVRAIQLLGTGFKTAVAYRYLLVAQPKVTPRAKKTFWIALGAVALAGALFALDVGPHRPSPKEPLLWFDGAAALFLVGTIVYGMLRHSKILLGLFITGTAMVVATLIGLRFVTVDPYSANNAYRALVITGCIGGAFAFLALFVGAVRAWFTFFTTVPIVGVWIGTMALVIVLAVMSGFETDLREKILGSNAHLQVTREDGDFLEWRDVKARLDKMPGVLASTPYAVSEVVVAAGGNGSNVIIKGIDPKTVGTVTDLVNDLDDREAMKRLEPIVDDPHSVAIPQTPVKHTVDPSPDDLPNGGDPTDFSAPPDAGSGSAAGPGSGSGSAAETHVPLVPDGSDTMVIGVTDSPDPTLARRTQQLPGMLVGKELARQTHMYQGEEVRTVSPLSDPSNPDATGSPVPFTRDYRVAGVFFTGMYEYDLKYVYVTLDSLQDFLDRGDAVDGLEIRIHDPDDTDAYVKKIGELLGPQYHVQDWKELNRSLFSALKLEKIAMFLVLGIVILVASFSIVGNLIMVVVEKQKEIALLKTLGASNGTMVQLFAIQGLMIGLIGTALGVAFGLVICAAGKRFGLPLNPDVYYIDKLPIHVESSAVLAAGAAGVLISILATVYPAIVAARIRPAEGMRHT